MMMPVASRSCAERLSDDILFIIFKLVGEEGKKTLHEYLEEGSICGVRWDDWGDAFEQNCDEWQPASDTPPQHRRCGLSCKYPSGKVLRLSSMRVNSCKIVGRVFSISHFFGTIPVGLCQLCGMTLTLSLNLQLEVD